MKLQLRALWWEQQYSNIEIQRVCALCECFYHPHTHTYTPHTHTLTHTPSHIHTHTHAHTPHTHSMTQAMGSVMKRVRHSDPHVQLQALTVHWPDSCPPLPPPPPPPPPSFLQAHTSTVTGSWWNGWCSQTSFLFFFLVLYHTVTKIWTEALEVCVTEGLHWLPIVEETCWKWRTFLVGRMSIESYKRQLVVLQYS